LIFRLAGWTGVVFHAGALLIAAHLAARLSLCGTVGAAQASEKQEHQPKKSHDPIPFEGER
jgi:hypothetical protein